MVGYRRIFGDFFSKRCPMCRGSLGDGSGSVGIGGLTAEVALEPAVDRHAKPLPIGGQLNRGDGRFDVPIIYLGQQRIANLVLIINRSPSDAIQNHHDTIERVKDGLLRDRPLIGGEVGGKPGDGVISGVLDKVPAERVAGDDDLVVAVHRPGSVWDRRRDGDVAHGAIFTGAPSPSSAE